MMTEYEHGINKQLLDEAKERQGLIDVFKYK
jgi:hypothetical protein